MVRSVWKLLVATPVAVCVAEAWTCVSRRSSPALKCFIPSTVHVRSSTMWYRIQRSVAKTTSTIEMNVPCFTWKLVWKPLKEQKLGKKVSLKHHFKEGWTRKKYRKRLNWKKARTLPYICCVHCTFCRCSALVFFHFFVNCFCTFLRSIPTWNDALPKRFPPVKETVYVSHTFKKAILSVHH